MVGLIKMRADDEVFHELSEENGFNVHLQNGFSHCCDMFVKYRVFTNEWCSFKS